MKRILLKADGFGAKVTSSWVSFIKDYFNEGVSVSMVDTDDVDVLVIVTVPDAIDCRQGSGFPNRILSDVEEAIASFYNGSKPVYLLRLSFATPVDMTDDLPEFTVLSEKESGAMLSKIHHYINGDPVSALRG